MRRRQLTDHNDHRNHRAGPRAEAGVTNAEFLKGYLEELLLPDASVDVTISNCIINLSGDKPKVLAEAARVLKPGGRLAVSDVIADPEMDEATKADMQAWTGCIAGALTETEFREQLDTAGLTDIEITETHRVHARHLHRCPPAHLGRVGCVSGLL